MDVVSKKNMPQHIDISLHLYLLLKEENVDNRNLSDIGSTVLLSDVSVLKRKSQ